MAFNFTHRLRGFKGWYPDVDPRDVTDETFAELVGFDPTRIPGVLSKDYGSSGLYADYPTDITTGGGRIIGHQTFYITALAQEFRAVWGLTASNQYKIYVRKYYFGGTLSDTWVELTEYLTGKAVTAINSGNKTIDVTVGIDKADDYFNGWVITSNDGDVLTIVDDTRLSATSHRFTVNENTVAFSNKRLNPSADLSVGAWKKTGGSTTNLYQAIDDGIAPNPNDIIFIGESTVSTYETQLQALSGTPYSGGFTKVYGQVSLTGTAYITIQVKKGSTVIANKTLSGGASRPRGSSSRGIDFVITISNAAFGSLEADFSDIRVNFTGTTNASQQASVYWLTCTVDVDQSFVGSNVNLFRNPIAVDQQSDWSGYGASLKVYSSSGKDKLLLGGVDTNKHQIIPLRIGYIDRDYFWGNDGAFFREYNGISLECAQNNQENFRRGITVLRGDTSGDGFRVVILPIIDGYQIGDPIYDDDKNTDTQVSITIEWGLFNKRITGFVVFSEYTGADSAIQDFDRMYLYIPSGQNTPLSISTIDNSTAWKTLTDNTLYYTFTVAAYNTLPETLTLNQYRGAAHTSGDINWRYRIQVSRQQTSLVAADESDDTIRFSYYDSFGIHNDDVFPNVGRDRLDRPTLVNLSIPGELLGMAEMAGNLFCFKRTAVQVIDLNNFTSRIFTVDCVAKLGIKSTHLGVMWVGQNGIYIFPSHGGLPETLNHSFIDTYKRISTAKKEAAIVEECRQMRSVIVSMQDESDNYTQYIYNYDTGIWWKRRLAVHPVWISVTEDGTFTATGGGSIIKYPDTSRYTDVNDAGTTTGVDWEIKSQWINFGDPEVEKTLRTIMPIVISNSSAQQLIVEMCYDRSSVVRDTLYFTTVNGKFERGLNVKLPNSFSELQYRIVKNPALDSISASGQSDISEIKFYGQISKTGKNN